MPILIPMISRDVSTTCELASYPHRPSRAYGPPPVVYYRCRWRCRCRSRLAKRLPEGLHKSKTKSESRPKTDSQRASERRHEYDSIRVRTQSHVYHTLASLRWALPPPSASDLGWVEARWVRLRRLDRHGPRVHANPSCTYRRAEDRRNVEPSIHPGRPSAAVFLSDDVRVGGHGVRGGALGVVLGDAWGCLGGFLGLRELGVLGLCLGDWRFAYSCEGDSVFCFLDGIGVVYCRRVCVCWGGRYRRERVWRVWGST